MPTASEGLVELSDVGKEQVRVCQALLDEVGATEGGPNFGAAVLAIFRWIADGGCDEVLELRPKFRAVVLGKAGKALCPVLLGDEVGAIRAAMDDILALWGGAHHA